MIIACISGRIIKAYASNFLDRFFVNTSINIELRWWETYCMLKWQNAQNHLKFLNTIFWFLYLEKLWRMLAKFLKANCQYQIPCLIISGTLIINNNIFKYRKPCRSRDRQNQCPFFDSIYNFGNKGIRDDDTITGYICS